jgi:hypothetical protein
MMNKSAFVFQRINRHKNGAEIWIDFPGGIGETMGAEMGGCSFFLRQTPETVA